MNVKNSTKPIVLFVCSKRSDLIFWKEVKLHAIFFSMLIVKPPIIENSDYNLFYSENLRFTIDFRNRYQLQECDGALCQKHIFICTDFAVIVFGDITGSLRTVLLILQWYTRKSLSEDVFESRIKEGLVAQGLSL